MLKIKGHLGVMFAAVWIVLAPIASAAGTSPVQPTVAVVMMSDLHFDPYADPAKYAQLRAADVSQWEQILSGPSSEKRTADFASLQKTCRARGVDSSWEILKGSLVAAHHQLPAPLFVTVSGDLLVHKFDCRWKTLQPSMSEDDLSIFAEKTIAFVALQLSQTFPGVPIYLALGNNDSGCGDYRETTEGRFTRSTRQAILDGLTNGVKHLKVLPAMDQQMDYSVVLPHPIKNGRLIVLEDTVQSPEFLNCKGENDSTSAPAQIQWLRAQLLSARGHHEHVWVMAHIPPGVDQYASFHQVVSADKLCAVTTPTMMLSSNALSDTLTEFADVVQLAIFAHTHMDEISLLRNATGGRVAAKLVPSITPINGNRPAFTVAEVEPKSAVLTDYSVYAADSAQAASFTREYSYASAYGMTDYSAKSVETLTNKLSEDKAGMGEASVTYQRWFLPGDDGAYAGKVKKTWPSYGCGTARTDAKSFRSCMCPASMGADAQ